MHFQTTATGALICSAILLISTTANAQCPCPGACCGEGCCPFGTTCVGFGVCCPSGFPTVCGGQCCGGAFPFCCPSGCSSDRLCGQCPAGQFRCGDECCENCEGGGKTTQFECGGDVCGCSDTCVEDANCADGCCVGGLCAPACACEASMRPPTLNCAPEEPKGCAGAVRPGPVAWLLLPILALWLNRRRGDRHHRHNGLISVVGIVLLLSGCDDSADLADKKRCVDSCPATSEVKCSDELSQTCTMQPNGCLAWTNSQTECVDGKPCKYRGPKSCDHGRCMSGQNLYLDNGICDGTQVYVQWTLDGGKCHPTCSTSSDCESGCCFTASDALGNSESACGQETTDCLGIGQPNLFPNQPRLVCSVPPAENQPAECQKRDSPCDGFDVKIEPIESPPFTCGIPGQVVAAIVAEIGSFWNSQIRACAIVGDNPLPRGNAWSLGFCETGPGAQGVIYYDPAILELQAFRSGTVVAPSWFLAHEVGHQIQSFHNSAPELSIGRELGADCLAGYFVGSLICSGRINRNDVAGTLSEVCAGQDPAQVQWFDEMAHGTCTQRQSAFLLGVNTYLAKDLQDPLLTCNDAASRIGAIPP